MVAVNSATGLTQSTVTTSGGLYNINLLPIGRYTVTVTKAGFQKATRPEVAVIAGQTFTVDFVLQAGEQRQQQDPRLETQPSPRILSSSDHRSDRTAILLASSYPVRIGLYGDIRHSGLGPTPGRPG